MTSPLLQEKTNSIDQDKNSERAVSSFLQILVDRGTISLNIAMILNRLPDIKDQSTALNKLRERVPALAESIVAEMRGGVEKGKELSEEPIREIFPNWLLYPYTEDINKKISELLSKNPKLYYKLANFLIFLLFFGLLIKTISTMSRHQRPDQLSEPAAITQAADKTPAVNIPIENIQKNKETINSNKVMKENDSGSLIPHSLKYHRLSKLKYQITWKMNGGNHKYHLYSSRSQTLNDLKRENLSPVKKPNMEWTAPEPGSYWIVTTSIDENGRQGPYSPELKINAN